MLIWNAFRFFLFLLPAEFTHELAKLALKFYSHFLAPFSKPIHFHEVQKGKMNFLGVANPIGLAAGFDKNAEILAVLPSLGFGYAEIGTVTPKPQGGNEKPRLFRDSQKQALFNRMGFNNLGAGIVSDRLRKIKPKLPTGFKVGVNLGKNKMTPDEDAALDYAKVARTFLDCADYFVINVSSPNTPGLRALQTEAALIPIIQAVKKEVGTLPIPILVKLAPELSGPPLASLIQAMEKEGIAGLVLTNTLGGTLAFKGKNYTGGWSGKVLTEESGKILKEVKKITSLPIISVGGIDRFSEMNARLLGGADLIQIYTGWVYQGPFFIRNVLRELKLF